MQQVLILLVVGVFATGHAASLVPGNLCWNQPICALWCQWGNQVDVNGCPLCACKPPPFDLIGKRSCPPVMCMMFCENGFQLDATSACPVCSCNTEPQTDCQKELADSHNKPLIGAFVPACEQDGSYAAMQCHGSTGYCWCVNTEGERISDQSRDMYSCDCVRHRDEETNKQLIGSFIPRCELDGAYSSLQCWGSTGMCWCSDKDGNKLSQPQHGTPNC